MRAILIVQARGCAHLENILIRGLLNLQSVYRIGFLEKAEILLLLRSLGEFNSVPLA